MKWTWMIVGIGAMALAGCLTQPRTPYNEVALFSREAKAEADEPRLALERAPEVENYWPLYLSDGRASYFLWPIVKSSPGCFALQPFYNYDHGIHDLCWFVTLSPPSGEYRVWPIFYRNPQWWMVLGLAYACDEVPHESAGSPLLFNWSRDWYTTTARTGEQTRVAPRKECWGTPLLWGMERKHLPPHLLPVDTLDDSYVRTCGTEWQALLSLLHSDRSLSIRKPWQWDAYRDFELGWLLWRWHEAFHYDHGPDSRVFRLFTPLYAYGKKDDLRTGKRAHTEQGLLFNAIDWRFKDERYDSSRLLWGLLFSDDITDFDHFERRETHLLCGLLLHRSCYGEDSTLDAWKNRHIKERVVTDNLSTQVLLGLLYNHTRTDKRTWEWPTDSKRPEAPTEDTYEERLSVLTPIVYNYQGERDGSFGSRVLFGLLYDRTYEAARDVETRGVLGYLYRANRYADGVTKRNLFPFVEITTHKDNDDWTFAFIHKVFRIEKTDEGIDWWLFWL